MDDLLIARIAAIVNRCDEDLQKNTLKTRDADNMIKAFHYDNIRKLVKDETGTAAGNSKADGLP